MQRTCGSTTSNHACTTADTCLCLLNYRVTQLTMPYWLDSEAGGRARWRLATVVALTLGTTGVRCRIALQACVTFLLHPFCVHCWALLGTAYASCAPIETKHQDDDTGFLSETRARRSVTFNFLGRDFFNAISEKDAERFYQMLVKWLCALCAGIPVYVFRDYFQVRSLVLEIVHLACR